VDSLDKDVEKGNMIAANKIVNDPKIVDQIDRKYQIIWDQSLTDNTCNNLNRAINVMAEKGWQCVRIAAVNRLSPTMSTSILVMYALMEKV
jgi:hypothetical protein